VERGLTRRDSSRATRGCGVTRRWPGESPGDDRRGNICTEGKAPSEPGRVDRRGTQRSRPISRHRVLLRRWSTRIPTFAGPYTCREATLAPGSPAELPAAALLPPRDRPHPACTWRFAASRHRVRGGLGEVHGGVAEHYGRRALCRSHPPGNFRRRAAARDRDPDARANNGPPRAPPTTPATPISPRYSDARSLASSRR